MLISVIQFEDNDINKPIILGTLYNGKNRPAYKLPQNKTQSGIKTRSSKGATPDQCNEIRFEDKKDNEELYIQAQKDHNMLVKHDQSRAIGNDQYVSVGNNRSEIIKKSRQSVIAEGSDKLQVEQEINIQSVKAGIILEADKFIEFRTGKSVITLQSNGKIIIKGVQVDIDGTKGVNLNGGQSPGSKRLTPNKAKGIFTTPKERGAAIPKIKVTPVEMMTVTKVDVNAKSRAAMPSFMKVADKKTVPRENNYGLNTDEAMQAYIDDVRPIMDNWSVLSPKEKKHMLQAAVSETLNSAGVPDMKVASKNIGGAHGVLDVSEWKIVISKNLMTAQNLTQDEIQGVMQTVYHEIRHAEQWWDMQRLSEDKLAGLEEDFYEKAREVPMAIDSERYDATLKFYESVYGANSEHRGQVLKELKESSLALNYANGNYDALLESRDSTEEERGVFRQMLVDAKERRQAIDGPYRALPEEKDAWAVADKLGTLF